MLDHSLLGQLIVTLAGSLSFIVVLEGFGWTVSKLVLLIGRRYLGDTLSYNLGIVGRVFIGGVAYTLLFLAIGWIGLLTKALVLALSCSLPVVVFILGKRWKRLSQPALKKAYLTDRYVLWGGLAFLLITFVLWFRPITNFDALWYHLTVPKIFLQNHTVAYQGSLIRYSLQPSLDYFWNLWALSLPLSTPIAGMIINGLQAIVLSLSLAFAANAGRQLWGWNKYHTFVAPLIVGGTYEILRQIGTGGNDTLGLAYGVVAVIFCFSTLHQAKITWTQLIFGLLLIVGLATVKIFFSIFAVLVLAYFLFGCWNKLPTSPGDNKKLIRVGLILLALFVITYLPWLIRSYLATGRLLDPLGSPGFNQGVYWSEGGGTFRNHWTNFIFQRFYANAWAMLTFIYSPLILISFFALFSKKMQTKETINLWLVSLAGFFAVFFASIALQWRYYLPPATLLVYLGLSAIIFASAKFDIFGKLVLWGTALLLVGAMVIRAAYAAPDNTGFPSINGLIYVRHFTSINDYLNKKLFIGTYDYVQETSPRGLKQNENIYIGNANIEPLTIYGLQKLAYVKNPFLEHSINQDQFHDVRTVDGFIAAMHRNKIRYIVTHDKITDVCKVLHIRDYANCADPKIFKHVLRDTQWDVGWYLLQS